MTYIVRHGWIEGDGGELEVLDEFGTLEEAEQFLYREQPWVELNNGYIYLEEIE